MNYDMFYYVKFTALSIKTICRALSLLVLKILAVYWDPRYQKVFNIAYLNKLLANIFKTKRDRALQIVLMKRAVNLT